MSLESWVRRAAAGEPFDLETWGARSHLVLARAAQTFQSARESVGWAGVRSENLAWNLGHALGALLWDTGIELSERLPVVHAAPSFIEQVCKRNKGSGGAFMFWENLVEFHEAQSPNQEYHAMQGAMFDALSVQAGMRSKCCQMSALHGLNHLWHPATLSLIKRISGNLADDETRAYAEAAASFSNM